MNVQTSLKNAGYQIQSAETPDQYAKRIASYSTSPSAYTNQKYFIQASNEAEKMAITTFIDMPDRVIIGAQEIHYD